MKKLVTLIAAVVLCAAINVNAQSYSPVTLTTATTIVKSTASNTTAVVYCGAQHDVAFQLSFKTSAAGTGKVIAYLVPSVDGTLYDTTKLVAVEGAGVSAGTQVTVTTNIATSGYGWFKLSYITNADPGFDATNVICKYSSKKSAP